MSSSPLLVAKTAASLIASYCTFQYVTGTRVQSITRDEHTKTTTINLTSFYNSIDVSEAMRCNRDFEYYPVYLHYNPGWLH